MFCARATTHRLAHTRSLYFFRSKFKTSKWACECVHVFLSWFPSNRAENSIHVLRRMFVRAWAFSPFHRVQPVHMRAAWIYDGLSVINVLSENSFLSFERAGRFYWCLSEHNLFRFIPISQLFQFPVELANWKQVSWFIVLSLDRQTFAMNLANAHTPTATLNNNDKAREKNEN